MMKVNYRVGLSEVSFVASIKAPSLACLLEGKGSITYCSKHAFDFLSYGFYTFLFIKNFKCQVEICFLRRPRGT